MDVCLWVHRRDTEVPGALPGISAESGQRTTRYDKPTGFLACLRIFFIR